MEFLSNCQGLDFLHPLKTTPVLESVWACLRESVPFAHEDRVFSEDIAEIVELINNGAFERVFAEQGIQLDI